MKILFIYKYNFIEPVGLMYISSALVQAGHETFFYDTELSSQLEGYIQKLQPDVIAYSVVTGNHHYYAEINKKLKKQFSFFAVFGGPHATFFPNFINEEGVDAICRGEGEEPMVELVNALAEKNPLVGIKNFWIKKEGTIHQNPVRNLQNNLDTIPFPDRSLVYGYPQYKYRANKYILTSRGCPFNCTYCFNHALKTLYKNKGEFCRKRSVENVIREIEQLQKIAPVKTVHFFDDIFILDKKWLLEFCKVYKEQINIPFICYVRVNLVDEEIIAALKVAGVHTITYAIETADDFLRNQVLKRNIKEEQILHTARLLQKYNIRSFTQNMVGLPGETIEKSFKTLKLNIACRSSCALASIFQPYPGTELTAYAVEKGYYDEKVEITHDSFFEKSLLKMPDQKKFENLAWLFSLGVAYPGTFFLIKFLIKLPLGSLYKAAWHISRAYGYLFRIRWIAITDIARKLMTFKVKGGVPRVE